MFSLKLCTSDYITTIYSAQFSSVHSVVPSSLQPHGPQHTRPPCPSPAPGVYSNSCPLSRWCHPTILSSVVLFFSGLQPIKKVYRSFAKTSKWGTLCPLLMSMSEASSVPFHCNKTSATQEPCVVKPGLWCWSWIFYGDHESDIVHCKLSKPKSSLYMILFISHIETCKC